MKTIKRAVCVILSVLIVLACFAGCSSKNEGKYSDSKLIIGYNQELAPFLSFDKKGKAAGFEVELWGKIFDSIKGDFKSYCFEKIEEGYALEEDGGFTGDSGREYSAALLFAVRKNTGSFNNDYSFTEPIITNRVIAVTTKESKVKSFGDFKGASVAVLSDVAKEAFEKNEAISSVCRSTDVKSLDEALSLLENGSADVLVVDEFTFMSSKKKDSFVILENNLETIEYVIACPKNSGWKDSINEAIRELKSDKYGDGDEFTPIVKKYFKYNASSFNYETDGDK